MHSGWRGEFGRCHDRMSRTTEVGEVRAVSTGEVKWQKYLDSFLSRIEPNRRRSCKSIRSPNTKIRVCIRLERLRLVVVMEIQSMRSAPTPSFGHTHCISQPHHLQRRSRQSAIAPLSPDQIRSPSFPRREPRTTSACCASLQPEEDLGIVDVRWRRLGRSEEPTSPRWASQLLPWPPPASIPEARVANSRAFVGSRE